MAEIPQIEYYQGVVLGFENLLANTSQEQENAFTDGCQQLVEDLNDHQLPTALTAYRRNIIPESPGEAQAIAEAYYHAAILDDIDPTDSLVTAAIDARREAYRARGEQGFVENIGAVDFILALNKHLLNKQVIISTEPKAHLKAFLNKYDCAPSFGEDRLISVGQDRLPAPEDYERIAEILEIERASELLVIDSSVHNLQAAEVTGATITPFISFAALRRSLHMEQAAKFAPTSKCSPRGLQLTQS